MQPELVLNFILLLLCVCMCCALYCTWLQVPAEGVKCPGDTGNWELPDCVRWFWNSSTCSQQHHLCSPQSEFLSPYLDHIGSNLQNTGASCRVWTGDQQTDGCTKAAVTPGIVQMLLVLSRGTPPDGDLYCLHQEVSSENDISNIKRLLWFLNIFIFFTSVCTCVWMYVCMGATMQVCQRQFSFLFLTMYI